MNRTDCIRSRIRRHDSNNDKLRQKEHFAKVRMLRVSETARLENHPFTSEGLSHQDEQTALAAPPGKGQLAGSVSATDVHSVEGAPPFAGPNSSSCSDRNWTQTSKSNAERIDTNSFAAKKRRLLDQLDWTGISLQKPITIEYPRPAKRLKESHGSRNLRKCINFGANRGLMSASSQASAIHVRVGSQDFR